MTEITNRMCDWKDCDKAAAKHVVCYESQEAGISEKGFGLQLSKWHVDLCEAHLSGLPSRFRVMRELVLDQKCEDCPRKPASDAEHFPNSIL